MREYRLFDTSPADGLWGIWPHGLSRLCFHLWEHWLFTRDEEFLRDVAYEMIRESSLFFLDTMFEDKKERLVMHRLQALKIATGLMTKTAKNMPAFSQ